MPEKMVRNKIQVQYMGINHIFSFCTRPCEFIVPIKSENKTVSTKYKSHHESDTTELCFVCVCVCAGIYRIWNSRTDGDDTSYSQWIARRLPFAKLSPVSHAVTCQPMEAIFSFYLFIFSTNWLILFSFYVHLQFILSTKNFEKRKSIFTPNLNVLLLFVTTFWINFVRRI